LPDQQILLDILRIINQVGLFKNNSFVVLISQKHLNIKCLYNIYAVKPELLAVRAV